MITKSGSSNAARWTALNPILASGIIGSEMDTGKYKVGNGVSTWTELPYSTVETSGRTSYNLSEHIESDTPHPVYDDGPSLSLLYENAKV